MLGAADAAAAAAALVTVLGPADLLPAAVLMPVLLVVVYKIVGLYDRDCVVLRRSTLREVPRLAEICGLFALLTWLLANAFVSVDLARLDVLLLWVVVFCFDVGGRAGARAFGRAVSPPERCAIVGEPIGLARFEQRLERSRAKAQVVGRLTYGGSIATRPPVGDAFAAWLRAHRVERLIVAPVGTDGADSFHHVRQAHASGIRVSLLPRLLEAVGSSVDFESIDGLTVLGVRPHGLSRSSRTVKRTLDVVGAGLGLVVASPLMVMFGLTIRLTSPGPALFRQLRVGRDGTQFEMLKFRSMVDGAQSMRAQFHQHEPGDGLFKVADDPRVTRVGRFLRATSLDELPQLWNVLRGQMSLVGPRPLVADEDALISGVGRARLHLAPGMTGPWQILDGRRVPLEDMISIDCIYVANWSLWRDIEILIRTAAHMARRRGM